jgi:hypothetical protein
LGKFQEIPSFLEFYNGERVVFLHRLRGVSLGGKGEFVKYTYTRILV